jgi:serine/threonine protein kinase
METITLPPTSTRPLPLNVTIEKKIGEGSFGKVFRIMYNGTPAALKIVKNVTTNQDIVDTIQQEIKMLERISQQYPNCTENVLCYWDISKDSENIYFVSELLDMDFFDLISSDIYGNLSKGRRIDLVYNITMQMLNGIRILHMLGILHRDIKLENFLVKYGNPPVIKIADFGFSCYYMNKNKQNECRGRPGSLSYVPPHIMIEANDPVWSVMDDIYSLACVIYGALTLSPFIEETERFREMMIGYLRNKVPASTVEGWYEMNYAKRMAQMSDMFSNTQEMTNEQRQKYMKLRDFCMDVLNPRFAKKIYSTDDIVKILSL